MNALTAREEVLLAASKLQDSGSLEFSEWDLTVASWKVNKAKWGLRGYEDRHPDHKRVMMELMGKGGLVHRGWLAKSRANHYVLTDAGRRAAADIDAPLDTRRRSWHTYEELQPFVFSRVFEDYLRDASQPKTWLGAEAFLRLHGAGGASVDQRMRQIRQAIDGAFGVMEERGEETLSRGDQPGGQITRERLRSLEGFLETLESRFERQIAALVGRK